MKICIIFRGPLRPNKESVIENIKKLSNCFSNFDYDILIASWNSEPDLRYVFNNIKCKYLISEEVPKVQHNFGEHSFSPINCIKQFYLANIAIDFILKKNIYDFIVIARTDLNISINPIDWLNSGYYSTIHAKKCGQLFTNDQFGVAEPNLMKSVWRYNDIDSLCNIVDSCSYPEQIIDSNIDNYIISVRQEIPIKWSIVR